MGQHTHQTVRLRAGKHDNPAAGVCVMELASMLAGEPFDDHPKSVCPVVGLVLRAYNDGLSDERRQDLYAYASASVGTASGRQVQRRRAEMCLRHFRIAAPRYSLRFGRTRRSLVGEAVLAAGRTATDRSHARMLRFIDELIAVGARSVAPAPAAAPALAEAQPAG